MTDVLNGQFTINFEINDRTKNFPQRPVSVHASQPELDDLVRDGFLIRRGLIPAEWIEGFGEALKEIAAGESGKKGAEELEGNGLYFRSLLQKSEAFHRMIKFEPTLSIGRALLGPQVSFDMEARIALPGVAGAGVPWHIHMRVIPDPMPPFFCYPHSVHGLIYLDSVGDDEGPLCVIPGSHVNPRMELDGTYDKHPDEVQLTFNPGDTLIMHGNLWHRTVPTNADCKQRRLVLFGYAPSWIKNDLERGVKTDGSLTDMLRKTGDAEMIELLDGFHW
ncbi:phytanoyl-CoA dioxygenase family protein [Actinoplanes sp. NPDC051343]|uniref:phytanoyl-CoA dioxygenase family protein n=1 Tax=Actinoplanes sp. NPDC051343 TaxID=3363906 RepID=UPI00379E7B2D